MSVRIEGIRPLVDIISTVGEITKGWGWGRPNCQSDGARGY